MGDSVTWCGGTKDQWTELYESASGSIFPLNLSFFLNNNVRYYRLKAGLTQFRLAKLCGCSKNTISSIELLQRFPSALLAACLCKALHCSFDTLFFLEEV